MYKRAVKPSKLQTKQKSKSTAKTIDLFPDATNKEVLTQDTLYMLMLTDFSVINVLSRINNRTAKLVHNSKAQLTAYWLKLVTEVDSSAIVSYSVLPNGCKHGDYKVQSVRDLIRNPVRSHENLLISHQENYVSYQGCYVYGLKHGWFKKINLSAETYELFDSSVYNRYRAESKLNCKINYNHIKAILDNIEIFSYCNYSIYRSITLTIKNMKIVTRRQGIMNFGTVYPNEDPALDHISLYEWFNKIVF